MAQAVLASQVMAHLHLQLGQAELITSPFLVRNKGCPHSFLYGFLFLEAKSVGCHFQLSLSALNIQFAGTTSTSLVEVNLTTANPGISP